MMAEYVSMGGYGAFIWPAYFISAAVIAGLCLWAFAERKQTAGRLKRLKAAEKDAAP